MKLVSSLTRIQMIPIDMLASIPFETRDTSRDGMELVTEEALEARRIIAANLKLETITALRSRPDPQRPDLDLMQALYDSGFKQCPASGMPVFDPSKCSSAMRETLWRAYCGIAIAIDDSSMAAEAVAALDGLKLEIERLGLPPTPPPSPPCSDDEDDTGGGMIGVVESAWERGVV
jgi:hypothetical protein